MGSGVGHSRRSHTEFRVLGSTPPYQQPHSGESGRDQCSSPVQTSPSGGGHGALAWPPFTQTHVQSLARAELVCQHGFSPPLHHGPRSCGASHVGSGVGLGLGVGSGQGMFGR